MSKFKFAVIGTLSAVVIMGAVGTADAAPKHNNSKNQHHNNRPQQVQVVHKKQNVRPTRTPARTQQVNIVHVNRNVPQQRYYSHNHNHNCHSGCNNNSNNLLGVIAVGAITGGILYALAN